MMESLLNKMKLTDYLSSSLKMSQLNFYEKLSAITEESSNTPFSRTFEVFASSDREYSGEVRPAYFKIRRRRRLFDTYNSLANAEGSITTANGETIVETKISALKGFILFPIGFFFLFLVLIILGISSSNDNNALLFLPFLFLQFGLIFSVFYLALKRGVQRFKYDLEREFYYLTK